MSTLMGHVRGTGKANKIVLRLFLLFIIAIGSKIKWLDYGEMFGNCLRSRGHDPICSFFFLSLFLVLFNWPIEGGLRLSLVCK